ncbi:hypothetical protein NTGBS_930017 [Candidatus Nitrotoga sp. BS]|uniref:YebC/PmpR family DNA-binding transcriptional regulator n=1 Tax=Candidatus Nitrotoga sp. BS TaxID=2890408 RepID=UPI001F878F8C|nr:YebC/PmpR family DNA-binding transcriptional regulator [Candidatus Nitrotoga sp. BS]CAH1212058.1 hypothetical protein NTGBS_930017 [Candidatus Nitrotoga sp. BS]
MCGDKKSPNYSPLLCRRSLAKEIMVAAKGGADIGSNSCLRLVVEQAKKASMPKDTLDRAIKKGAGLAAHFL